METILKIVIRIGQAMEALPIFIPFVMMIFLCVLLPIPIWMRITIAVTFFTIIGFAGVLLNKVRNGARF